MRKKLFLVLTAALFATHLLAAQYKILKIGLMPAVNIAPILVADSAGYFGAEGLAVELVLFKNQVYRETALQTGQIDGTVSDLINAVNAVAHGFPVKATSASEGVFGLLASPKSAVSSIEAWRNAPPEKRIKTGLLENSIVYYVTERLLEGAGADTGKIDLVSSAQLPVRMEMLLAGKLEAACLPEPMMTAALGQGAQLIADTHSLPFTPGVLLFTDSALKEKAESVKAFYRAYNRGAADLASSPESYRALILEKGEFPPSARGFVLPSFKPARKTSGEEYADVTKWMKQKGLIGTVPDYKDVVDGSFLP